MFPGLIVSLATPAAAQESATLPSSPPWPVRLRHVIQRTANVELRLQSAAGRACPAMAAATGLVLDSLDAYAAHDRPLARASLGLGDHVQVAAVAIGSPAARAGIIAGDQIIAIDGIDLQLLAGRHRLGKSASHAMRATAELTQRHAGVPMQITLLRNATPITIKLVPQELCASHIYVSTESGMHGYSDGDDVVLSANMVDFTRSDDELALLAGHELAHAIARDGKVSRVTLRRSMEDRADLLGADLAACAGYDPHAGAGFWQHLAQARAAADSRLRHLPLTHSPGQQRTDAILHRGLPAACPITGALPLSPTMP